MYAAVAWSLTAGNAIDGALLMLGFGLGTLPAMLLAGSLMQGFSRWARAPAVRTTAGVLLILFGVYGATSGLLQGGHAAHLHTDAQAILQQPAILSMRAPASFDRAAASRISTSRRLTPSTPDS